MFHFPTFPPLALCVQARVTGHDSSGVSPFGDPRIKACLPAPRGLSQVTTSFFGSYCQGIHHVLLETCLTDFKDARVHCAVLKLRAGPSTTGAYRAWLSHNPAQRFIQIQRSVRPVSWPEVELSPDPSGPNSVPCSGAAEPQPFLPQGVY